MGEPLWLQALTVAAVTFALAMLAILLARRARERRAEADGVAIHVTPYLKKGALLSSDEHRFYVRLYEAVGEELLVCPKVHLADVIDVRGDALDWQIAWNRVAAKQVDFLLVKPDTLEPLLAVQLDRTPHSPPQEEWIDRALVAAGLPVLRQVARRDYDPAFLRNQVEQKLAQ